MSTPGTLKQRLSAVMRLWNREEYDKALAEIEILLERWPGNLHLYVLKAGLLQLQDEPKYDLDEAKLALQQAIDFDRSSPTSSIELGHFLDNVEDDPEAAVDAYTEGITTARRILMDGLLGQAKAYLQLGKKEAFLRCLVEVSYLAGLDSGPKKSKGDENGTGVFAGPLKRAYSKQLEELLSELCASR